MFAANDSKEEQHEEQYHYIGNNGKKREVLLVEEDQLFLTDLAALTGTYRPEIGFPTRLAEEWKDISFYRYNGLGISFLLFCLVSSRKDFKS